MNQQAILLVGALLATALVGASAQGVLHEGAWTQVETAELNTVDAHANFWTGRHVDVEGDTLVVSGGLFAEGAVYVFVHDGSGWVEEARIRPEPMTGACAISGDTLVAGAYTNAHAGYQSGAAYVYVRSGGVWSQEAFLAPTDLLPEDRFGFAVDIDGERVVVGAPRSLPDDAPGRVYVFERNGAWSQDAVLQTPIPAGADEFGAALSLDADRVAVGAPEYGVTGTCFLFEHDGSAWTVEDELTGSGVVGGVYYGAEVALSGTTAAVNVPYQDPGWVYVFVEGASGWTEEAVLGSPDATHGFGWSLALDGDSLLASAHRANEGRPDAGCVHYLTREADVWSHTGRLVPTDPETGSFFASDVALDAQRAVLGAYLDDSWGFHSGAVYAYELFAGAASNYGDATPNSAAVVGRMALAGTTSLAAEDLILHAVGAPAKTTGLFFYGFDTAAFPFGNGVLCVSPFAPGLVRLAPVVQTDAFGSAAHALAASELPPGFAPQTLFFQFYFRDATAGGALFDLTDGLGVTFVD